MLDAAVARDPPAEVRVGQPGEHLHVVVGHGVGHPAARLLCLVYAKNVIAMHIFKSHFFTDFGIAAESYELFISIHIFRNISLKAFF